MDIQQTQPTQMRINLADVEDICCDKCGNRTFEPVVMLKRLSALASPTGKEEIIPLEPPICPTMYACYACGHVNGQFIHPGLFKTVKPPTDEQQKPKLELIK